MVLTSGQKTGYAVCLILTILLVGLHFSVAGAGHVFYSNDDFPWIRNEYSANGTNYAQKDFNQFAAFLIVAAGLTFFISIILLVALCTDKFSPKTRHILATLNLILEFAIAVTVSIAASQTSNLRDYLPYKSYQSNDDLELYYKLLISDAVITFVLEVIYLAVIYLGTLSEIQHTVLIASTVVQNPPYTADRLH